VPGIDLRRCLHAAPLSVANAPLPAPSAPLSVRQCARALPPITPRALARFVRAANDAPERAHPLAHPPGGPVERRRLAGGHRAANTIVPLSGWETGFPAAAPRGALAPWGRFARPPCRPPCSTANPENAPDSLVRAREGAHGAPERPRSAERAAGGLLPSGGRSQPWRADFHDRPSIFVRSPDIEGQGLPWRPGGGHRSAPGPRFRHRARSRPASNVKDSSIAPCAENFPV